MKGKNDGSSFLLEKCVCREMQLIFVEFNSLALLCVIEFFFEVKIGWLGYLVGLILSRRVIFIFEHI